MKTRRDLIRRIRESSEPLMILICGMPGTRKSTTAVKLAAALDIASVVGMDEVRDVMKVYDRDPFLDGKSHNRWQLFGELTDDNFRKGFYGHCRAMHRGAKAILDKNISLGENTILEGVHVLPSLYHDLTGARIIHFLLQSRDSDQHRILLDAKFSRRHGRQAAWTEEKIDRIRRIQLILGEEAEKYDDLITVISTTPDKNIGRMLEIISAKL